jgi:hypothetical protein
VLPWLGLEVPGLLELNIRWCPKIDQRGLEESLTSLKSLQQLKWRTAEEDALLLLKAQYKINRHTVCPGMKKMQAVKACITQQLSSWWLV